MTVDQDSIRKYDGILLTEVTAVSRAEIERIASSAGLLANFDVADGYVEFQFSGRDTNRFVVKMLSEIAGVIRDAKGEISCETTTDGDLDPTFEFFSIEHGQLMKQTGRIARGERHRAETF